MLLRDFHFIWNSLSSKVILSLTIRKNVDDIRNYLVSTLVFFEAD